MNIYDKWKNKEMELNKYEAISREIAILKKMNHKNIIKLIDYGNNGQIKSESGGAIQNLDYIMMEYFSGQTLFEFLEN